MAQLEPRKDEFAQAGAELVYVAAEKRGGVFKPTKFLTGWGTMPSTLRTRQRW
jgi:hypothetical protein